MIQAQGMAEFVSQHALYVVAGGAIRRKRQGSVQHDIGIDDVTLLRDHAVRKRAVRRGEAVEGDRDGADRFAGHEAEHTQVVRRRKSNHILVIVRVVRRRGGFQRKEPEFRARHVTPRSQSGAGGRYRVTASGDYGKRRAHRRGDFTRRNLVVDQKLDAGRIRSVVKHGPRRVRIGLPDIAERRRYADQSGCHGKNTPAAVDSLVKHYFAPPAVGAVPRTRAETRSARSRRLMPSSVSSDVDARAG